MTAASVPSDRARERGSRRREVRADRSVALLVAAAVLVVVTVAAVLLFGVQHPPALPTVAEDPPSGLDARIAWTGDTDGETCLEVATPAGEVLEPWCGLPDAEVAGWSADGEIVLRPWDPEAALLVVDPVSGESTTLPVGDVDPAPEPPGQDPVETRRQGGELLVSHGGGELWRTEAPGTYDIVGAWASPDDRWLALQDSADRLLVLPADGAQPPRVWARDVAWASPVWEGGDPVLP